MENGVMSIAGNLKSQLTSPLTPLSTNNNAGMIETHHPSKTKPRRCPRNKHSSHYTYQGYLRDFTIHRALFVLHPAVLEYLIFKETLLLISPEN
jgi:hypothetical protein